MYLIDKLLILLMFPHILTKPHCHICQKHLLCALFYMQKNCTARPRIQSTPCFMFLKYVWKQIGHQLKSYKFSCLCHSSDLPYQESPGDELGILYFKKLRWFYLAVWGLLSWLDVFILRVSKHRPGLRRWTVHGNQGRPGRTAFRVFLMSQQQTQGLHPAR